MTDDPDVRMAQSIMDYVFRRLALDYLTFDDRSELGIYTAAERARYVETGSYLSRGGRGGDVGGRSPCATTPVDNMQRRRRPASPPDRRAVDAGLTARPHDGGADGDADRPRRRRAAVLHLRHEDAPVGSCYVCEGCGSTSGCS